ncbi:hypothetical protein AOXY_G4937 [Acipenser oxyrinchus oxyrinchus]|uniref:WW domain-containing protein n=1 Tax=Acipenser oxyrinchus oxyrinchus TaxID=40147 RepID=A0AAD8GDU8_ACIOX|nr:hypothetical protein AOXY_G4937 [Acipenser oxyrinchus oxyrinchus]
MILPLLYLLRVMHSPPPRASSCIQLTSRGWCCRNSDYNLNCTDCATGVVGAKQFDRPAPSLPPNWKAARDPEGKIYYYHVITR